MPKAGKSKPSTALIYALVDVHRMKDDFFELISTAMSLSLGGKKWEKLHVVKEELGKYTLEGRSPERVGSSALDHNLTLADFKLANNYRCTMNLPALGLNFLSPSAKENLEGPIKISQGTQGTRNAAMPIVDQGTRSRRNIATPPVSHARCSTSSVTEPPGRQARAELPEIHVTPLNHHEGKEKAISSRISIATEGTALVPQDDPLAGQRDEFPLEAGSHGPDLSEQSQNEGATTVIPDAENASLRLPARDLEEVSRLSNDPQTHETSNEDVEIANLRLRIRVLEDGEKRWEEEKQQWEEAKQRWGDERQRWDDERKSLNQIIAKKNDDFLVERQTYTAIMKRLSTKENISDLVALLNDALRKENIVAKQAAYLQAIFPTPDCPVFPLVPKVADTGQRWRDLRELVKSVCEEDDTVFLQPWIHGLSDALQAQLNSLVPTQSTDGDIRTPHDLSKWMMMVLVAGALGEQVFTSAFPDFVRGNHRVLEKIYMLFVIRPFPNLIYNLHAAVWKLLLDEAQFQNEVLPSKISDLTFQLHQQYHAMFGHQPSHEDYWTSEDADRRSKMLRSCFKKAMELKLFLQPTYPELHFHIYGPSPGTVFDGSWMACEGEITGPAQENATLKVKTCLFPALLQGQQVKSLEDGTEEFGWALVFANKFSLGSADLSYVSACQAEGIRNVIVVEKALVLVERA